MFGNGKKFQKSPPPPQLNSEVLSVFPSPNAQDLFFLDESEESEDEDDNNEDSNQNDEGIKKKTFLFKNDVGVLFFFVFFSEEEKPEKKASPQMRDFDKKKRAFLSKTRSKLYLLLTLLSFSLCPSLFFFFQIKNGNHQKCWNFI